MAKQKGALKLTGKMGNTTLTQGKYGSNARQSAEFTEQQKEDARNRPQVRRTKVLNDLGSPIRVAIKHYNYGHITTKFWPAMLSAFRAEKSNHRVLLLKQLMEMDVYESRRFREACPVPKIFLKTTPKQYVIDADVSKPATSLRDGYDCYYLQFIIMVWNKQDDSVRHMEEQTGWLNPEDHSPKFTTIEFTKTALDTEWILACRLVEGVNCKETGYESDCRIRIIAGGTVSPESLKIIQQREKENEAKKNAVNNVPVAKPRKKLEIRDRM